MSKSAGVARNSSDAPEDRSFRRGPEERAGIYSQIASLYRAPSWVTVQGVLDRLILKHPACFIGAQPDLRLAEALDRLEREAYRFSLETFQDEYVRLFVNSPDGVAAPPHASFYSENRLPGEAAKTALAYYERFELAPAEANSDMPDHIINELEFLAILCAMEQEAEDKALRSEARRLRAAQADFLTGHLLEWANLFCERLTKSSRLAFYQLLGILTRGFLAQERERLERILNDKTDIV